MTGLLALWLEGEFKTGLIQLLRPYKKKILVLRHRRALKIPPDETFFIVGREKKNSRRPPDFYADNYNFLPFDCYTRQ